MQCLSSLRWAWLGAGLALAACLLLTFPALAQTIPPAPEPTAPLLTGVSALAAGREHTCALVAGAVKCWGVNDAGQLGDGTTNWGVTPVGVIGVTAATALAAGADYTCALVADGAVVCWGGSYGNKPLAVPNINGAAALAAGSSTACALIDGAVKCWGSAAAPTPSAVFGITAATAVAAGDEHACALEGGAVKCWGDNSQGQLGNGQSAHATAPTPAAHDFVTVPVTAIGVEGATVLAAGQAHTCAIVDAGAVMCWGQNYGSIPLVIPAVQGATALAAGGGFTCALTDGGVQCWGINSAGQLGDGTASDLRLLPKAVPGISNAAAITAGQSHTCVLVQNGAVKCWGSNFGFQLGDGWASRYRPLPMDGAGLSAVEGVATGDFGACALVSGGKVMCWGQNSTGQLGDNTAISRFVPQGVVGISGATAIAGSATHTCALVNGSVKCWGLGYGLSPVDVAGIAGASAIALGWDYTCVLLNNGSIKCWGRNDLGQLGDGTTTPRPTPVDVIGITDATAIAIGYNVTCAVLHDGGVKCWGRNDSGQLGDGTASEYRSTPVTVAGISGATAVATSGVHTCVVAAGQVKCWGFNGWGALGDGTTENRLTPGAAVDLGGATATAITIGWSHTCVLVSDGSMQCWGSNAAGQLGDGTRLTRSTPAAVLGIRGSAAIAAGGQHTCALVAGHVLCWGSTDSGQLAVNPGWLPVDVLAWEPGQIRRYLPLLIKPE